MNKDYNLILENINFLRKNNIEYYISINNKKFVNTKEQKKEIIKVEYKKENNVEIIFFDNIDEDYLLSFDNVIRNFCKIKKKESINNKIFDILSQLKPNITFEKTIENIKKTLKNLLYLDNISFYIYEPSSLFQNINFEISNLEKKESIYCNVDKLYLPVIFDNETFGHFIMKKNIGFDLYDYAILCKLNDYIRKTIENSFLENKFEIILDKSLNVLTSILETRVPGAEKHCHNIAKSAIKIGEYLNLEKKDIQNLKLGSMIFDIGKIGIPEYILTKKEELTKEENQLIKKHVLYGYELVSKIPTIPDKVKKIVLYHHEKWNGEGYPEGLEKNKIPLLAQIIGLLDTYYSLLEDRPYRNKLPKTKVLELIDSYSDIFFNPELVNALKEVVDSD
ncbi:HD-GYP domain-containing protein [Marinitoga sp. 1154]|uniref:HD-GYP domain-containing protein n=1 Tax=Marinitoga sp. 1154 TaxID=1643335 RepID=UPI001585DECD|nr:HD domain-containing phosphohydrolase [Marinitoga sp. 1154]